MLSSLLTAGLSLIDKIIPDKDAQEKARLQLFELEKKGELEIIAHQSNIIQTEAKSESKLARSWRPCLMFLCMGLIFLSYINNYFIYPCIVYFCKHQWIQIELPIQLWHLMEIGVGGYIAGRSVEKSISLWHNKKK